MHSQGHDATFAAPSVLPEARQGSAPAARVIAIVGGGFSGTCLAIQLLRQSLATVSPGRPRVVLIDPGVDPGAGLAYAARDYPYPLNVTAGQMSIDATRPNDFVTFARAQGIDAAPGDYLPRQVYGEYLRARLTEACQAAGLSVQDLHRRARVLQLRRVTDSTRWELWLDDGRAQLADSVVLAIGNAPPAGLPPLAPIMSSARYLDQPWSIAAYAPERLDSVLLVGSGLTMIDAALRLAALRPRVSHIQVLSRHGLLPASQAEPRASFRPDLDGILDSHPSMRAVSHAVRTLARDVVRAGGDWREVIGALRPHLAPLWHRLQTPQRAAFLRHLRAWWDVHRHRAPAGPLAAVRTLERLGVLRVHAGRLESTRLLDDAVEVTWRPRHGHRPRAWMVDLVVNCTGPDHRVARHPDPLVSSLLANGLIRGDELELGIDVAQDGRVISRDGTPVDSLHYLGPWLRARDWEATAVPELREHAWTLAQQLLRDQALATL